MRMRALRLLALGGFLLATLACGTARAYLVPAGAGSASAAVGSLAAPTLSATVEGETVTLDWSAVAPPGPGPVSYAVSRDGGAPGGDCPSSATPAESTSCTDSGLADGHHLYTVTAYFHSWMATAAPVEVVVSGSATRLVLAAASETSTAGDADDLTVTAEDAGGHVVTAYTGPHTLTFGGAEASPAGNLPTVADSSGAAVDFGSPTTLQFDEGVATVAGAGNGAMTLYAAETASITATDGSISTASALPVAVEAAEAQRLAFVELGAGRGSVEAPCLFTCAIEGLGNGGTVDARIAVTDAFGNVVSDLGSGHRVTVRARGGRVSGGRLAIAGHGPAESSRPFVFTIGRGRRGAGTITARTDRGTSYEEATASVTR